MGINWSPDYKSSGRSVTADEISALRQQVKDLQVENARFRAALEYIKGIGSETAVCIGGEFREAKRKAEKVLAISSVVSKSIETEEG